MNIIDKQKFLYELEKLLSGMTGWDRAAVLKKYESMYDCDKSEFEVSQSIGSPTRAAITELRHYVPSDPDADCTSATVKTQEDGEASASECELFSEGDDLGDTEISEADTAVPVDDTAVPEDEDLFSEDDELPITLPDDSVEQIYVEPEPEPELSVTLSIEDELFAATEAAIAAQVEESMPHDDSAELTDLAVVEEAVPLAESEESPIVENESLPESADFDAYEQTLSAEVAEFESPEETLPESADFKAYEEVLSAEVAEFVPPDETLPEAADFVPPVESVEAAEGSDLILADEQSLTEQESSAELLSLLGEDPSDDTALPERNVSVGRVVLFSLLFIVAIIPVTLALLAVSIALIGSSIAVGAIGVFVISWGYIGITVIADLLMIVGGGMLLMAPAILLLYFGIWFFVRATIGFAVNSIKSGTAWCRKGKKEVM